MKIDVQLPEIVRNICGKDLFYFYFLNVDISLIKQCGIATNAPHLKLYMCIENIAVEGTVSQIFDKGPSSFSIEFRKICSQIYTKSYPFFCIK